jgi:hypothetical protein
MTNKTILKTFTLASVIALAVNISSCKKDNNNSDGSITLEQLGDLKPLNALSVWFNHEGNPMISIEANSFLYEWNSTNNEWQKVGNQMPGGNRFSQVVQDNEGNYYGRYWNWIFELNQTTNNWDTLDIVENKISLTGAVNELLANANGDIMFQIQRNDNHHLFIKEASSNSWVKVLEYDNTDQDNRPYYFTNSGYVYFTGNTIPSPYPMGILRDKILNTNTGIFGLLFDKTEPANYNYSPYGSLSSAHIKPDGTVYFIHQDGATIYQAELMKITPGSYPAMITKMQDLDVPGLHSTGGWSSTTKAITVDASENIKTHIGCNNGSDPAHRAEATIEKGSSEIKTYGHPLNQRNIYANFNNETFVLEDMGYLYKWE